MDILYLKLKNPTEILELYKAVTKKYYGFLAMSEEECELKYFESVLERSSKGGINFGAYDGDRLIGFIYAFKSNLKFFSYLLEDVTLAVHPDYHGKGIGKNILTAFMNEVKSRDDIKRVELFTVDSNHRAIALYESFGFINEGLFKNRAFVNGYLVNDIAMAWLKNY